MRSSLSILLLSAVIATSMACTAINTTKPEPEPIPAPTYKPEIDYSGESPDCETAGQRIKKHVKVGMTLREVRRLVGNPRYKIPGSWWWSNSFSLKKSARPTVTFPPAPADDDLKVLSFTASTTGC